MWTRGRDFRKTVLEPLDVVMLHFGRPCWFLMRMPVGSIIDMLMISLHRMSSRCAFTLLPPLRTLCMVAGVQDNFLLATKIFNGQLIPTYHGTATSNLGSIFQRGLLQLGLHSSWVLSLSTDTTYMHTKEKTNISYRLYHGVCKLWVFALYLVGCFDSTAVGSGFHVKTAMTFAWPTGVRMAWASTPHRWTLHSSPWALPKDPKRC